MIPIIPCPDFEFCTPSRRSQMRTSESGGHNFMIVLRSVNLKLLGERAAI